MCLNRGDMYYGLLLSKLVNNRVAPTIMETGGERNVYQVTTDNGEYVLYVKYRKENRNNPQRLTWTFQFTPTELKEIHQHRNNEKNVYVALVCVNEEPSRFIGEIILLDTDKFDLCTGTPDQYQGQPKVCVRYKRNIRGLRVYGSGLADKIDGKETALHVARDVIEGL